MGGRGSNFGMNGTGKLRPVRNINEDWLYQPEPGTPMSDLRMNPIPFVGAGRDMELEEKLDYDFYTKVTNRRQNAEVNVSDLKTLQPLVTQSGVDRAMRGGAGMGNPVKVVSYKGQLYVLDGNHRAALAKMRGDKTIKVTLITRVDK